MNLKNINTALGLAAVIALSAIFSGCLGADEEWIGKRAAVLAKNINPETGKKYTPEAARKAAEAEDQFAGTGARAYVFGPALDAAASGMTGGKTDMTGRAFAVPAPASMSVAPSCQPAMPGHAH